MASPLDGHSQAPLVPGASARLPARTDTAELVDVPLEHIVVFVVDRLGGVYAESANALARPKATATPAAATTATAVTATAIIGLTSSTTPVTASSRSA
jgi:hypothetical protein